MERCSENRGRRIVVLTIGIFLLALGIALLKISSMGNDPNTGMNLILSERFGWKLPIVIFCMHSICFIVEIIWGRKYIGIGTFINWFCIGTLITIYLAIVDRFFSYPQTFISRLIVMIIAVLIVSLGCSFYQTADLGVAPYDTLSIIMSEKSKIEYFWCRIFTDGFCLLVTIIFGGVYGIGTFMCAMGLGPFVQFFTKYIARPLCKYND